MKPSVVDQVRALLEIEAPLERLRALGQLRDQAPRETLAALVHLLECPAEPIRRRAGGGLSAFSKLRGSAVTVEQEADALARILERGQDPRVRLSCAIALMPVRQPVVEHAFLRALADPFEKIVQIACVELSDRGGADVVSALLARLNHPSWRVRLEVCKALLKRKVADPRLVSTLEAMSREPEAALYDAESDEFDAAMKEGLSELMRSWVGVGTPPETWGKLEAILAKARSLRPT
jgi:HEAT repeat protein